MELLFESRLEIGRLLGDIHPVQAAPAIESQPVLTGSGLLDGGGVSCYGTVLSDGGRYRMWYRPWPKNWGDEDHTGLVCYAESDNGLDWRKPILGLVDYQGRENNLCDLPFDSVSVFIDPQASSAGSRYRATGFVGKESRTANGQVVSRGYNTARSADGFSWRIDPLPGWAQQDVITSIYHPERQCGLVAMKHTPRFGGFARRAIWTAELYEDRGTKAKCALIPDDYDDFCARSRGYVSGDYYGMGMMPAGKGTVGFLWQFRHSAPKSQGKVDGFNEYGVHGSTDVSLVYQSGEGERWLHPAGRPDFICHENMPSWSRGCVYTASAPVANGDEHWMYFTGCARTHGWYVDEKWVVNQERKATLIREGVSQIGLARWPKYRLFGFQSASSGEMDIYLGSLEQGCELKLNLKTEPEGSVKFALLSAGKEVEGYGLADSIPLSGDFTEGIARWQNGVNVLPINQSLILRVALNKASIFAYETAPRDEL